MDPVDVMAINDEPAALLIACSQLQYLRFSFQLRDLERLAGTYLQRWHSDSLIQALSGFALVNLDPLGVRGRHGMELLESAVATASENMEVVLVVMLGMRADAFRYARRIIEVSDHFARFPEKTCRDANMSGPTLFFHRSQAFRALASAEPNQSQALELVSEAEQSIQYAFQYLTKGPGTQDVLQDFVREREVVLETRMRVQQRASDESRRLRVIDEKMLEAESHIDGSLIRVVEILGVFVALIGFAVTAGRAGFSDFPSDPDWSDVLQRVALIIASGAGALCFFLMLRVAVYGSLRGRWSSK
jgi:hypothetical protein